MSSTEASVSTIATVDYSILSTILKDQLTHSAVSSSLLSQEKKATVPTCTSNPSSFIFTSPHSFSSSPPPPPLPLRSLSDYYEQTKHLGFWLDGDQIQVLYDPKAFYTRLKQNILKAKHRIILSALYVGHEEMDLINTLRLVLLQTPNLHVLLLMDYLRSTRGGNTISSIKALEPLKTEFQNRISIQLYHTPDLSGWKKHCLPSRLNETIGLLHFKLYIFDDTLIISGANLSRDYFTHRQDRYIEIQDASVTQHYAQVVETVSSFSFTLTSSNHLLPPMPCPIQFPNQFRDHAYHLFSSKLAITPSASATTSLHPTSNFNTLLIPAFQAAPLRIYQEQQLMQSVWKGLEHPFLTSYYHPTVWFTSGYFNLTPTLFNVLVSGQYKGPLHVLTASPKANSFFNSSGISKWVPHAYTYLEDRFLRRVHRLSQRHRVHLYEYQREGWTFHAKGVWISPTLPPSFHSQVMEQVPCHMSSSDSLPSSCSSSVPSPCSLSPIATIVGSSNFGHRSQSRDLEAQAFILTQHGPLQSQLHLEQKRLWEYAVPMQLHALKARNVHWLTKVTASLVKTMF